MSRESEPSDDRPAPDGRSFRYPHDARLRGRTPFHQLVKQGDMFPGRQCVVRRRPHGLDQGARLGMAAPLGYGKSTRRNRFRRLVREVFRHVRAELGPYDYLVSPRKSLREPTREGIREDLLAVLHRRPARKRP